MDARLEVKKLLLKMSLAYPHSNIPEETVDVYTDALEHVPLEWLKPALVQASLLSEFFPTLHRIREVLTDMMFGKVLLAEEAWAVVMKHLTGDAQPIAEPLIEKAVDAIGGWWYLRQSDNQMADRAQFMKIYGAFRERERQTILATPDVRAMQTKMLEQRYEKNAPVKQLETKHAVEPEGELIPMPDYVKELLDKVSIGGVKINNVIEMRSDDDGQTEMDMPLLPAGEGADN